MTPEALAALVNARRSGVRRWLARCPAHPDRSPSLSIAEGKDGRVVIRCWAGCATKDILAASGLTMRDLFAGPPATPQQAAMLAAEREAKAAWQRQQRAISRAARDRVFQLESLVDAIGEKLARSPDDWELERLFHEVCDAFHAAEADLYPVAPELGGLRLGMAAAIPAYIAAALLDIGRSFDGVKRLLDAGQERIA
ncbi:MAG TPA: hypothetical protein VND66_07365 [Acidobacteriaceae bacterium]|nr:hypothetical protein [Acidobacteriaceae bacterium]